MPLPLGSRNDEISLVSTFKSRLCCFRVYMIFEMLLFQTQIRLRPPLRHVFFSYKFVFVTKALEPTIWCIWEVSVCLAGVSHSPSSDCRFCRTRSTVLSEIAEAIYTAFRRHRVVFLVHCSVRQCSLYWKVWQSVATTKDSVVCSETQCRLLRQFFRTNLW